MTAPPRRTKPEQLADLAPELVQALRRLVGLPLLVRHGAPEVAEARKLLERVDALAARRT